jgi:glycosyltransferase involved in cell wall biosynthesis
MKILMLSDVFFPRVNGVSTSISTYRNDLRALGHDVTLVAPCYADGAYFTDDTDIVRLPARSVPRDPEDRFFHWRKLVRWTDALRPADVDVVHVQTPFAAHYAGVKLARRLGAPLVETYHTYFEHYLHHYVPFLPGAFMRKLARSFTVSQCAQAQAIVSPSRPMADALRDYGVRTPIEVLPTGLPPSCCQPGDGARFRAARGISPQRPMALFVGRAAHEKNIDFLLHMLLELRARIPDVLVVIAGEGPAEAHLHKLAEELGLRLNIMFIGYMDRTTELLDCYRAADVFVFASRTETQGLVLIEALAQGTPVVSTAVMGTADVMAQVSGGLVVEEDTVAFADAVAQVMRDHGLRAELSAKARHDAERWSSRHFAERLLRLYERVVDVEPAVESTVSA